MCSQTRLLHKDQEIETAFYVKDLFLSDFREIGTFYQNVNKYFVNETILEIIEKHFLA